MTAPQQMLMGKSGTVSFSYATWNPVDKDVNVTLSGGNLTAVSSTSSSVRATIGKSSGKWYWEIHVDSGTTISIGIAQSTDSLATIAGNDVTSWGYLYQGNIQNNSGLVAGPVTTYTAGDVIGVALNLDTNSIRWYKNNVSQDAESISAGTYYPVVSWSATSTANFGATTMAYAAPAGYNAGLYT